MELEMLRAEMDAAVFSGLANAADRLAAVDKRYENQIAALVNNPRGPCVLHLPRSSFALLPLLRSQATRMRITSIHTQ